MPREHDKVWNAFIKRHFPAERRLAKDVRGYFKDQWGTVRENIERHPVKALYKASNEEMIRNWRFEREEWENLFKAMQAPHIEETVTIAGEAAFRDITGSANDFELHTDDIDDFMKMKAAGAAKNINKTTTDFLNIAFDRLLEDGATTAQVVSATGKYFTYCGRFRGVMIARTETTGCLNFGDTQADMQSGEIWGNEWIAAMDELTRYTHMDVNGQAVPLGERFPVVQLEFPGDPTGDIAEIANCRCALFRLEKAPAGW